MFPFLIPLLGAAGGAILNKKDPLKGALMGGGLAAGGGALLGAGGLGGAPAAGLSAGQDAALAAQGFAGPESMAGPGMFDKFKGLLDTSSEYTKPLGNALGAANQAQGLLSQPQQPAPMVQPGNGQGVGQTIGGIVQGQEQLDQQRIADARKKMQGLLGGGFYG